MTTERKYLEKQVVLVGYGRVGQRIAEALSNREIPSSWPNRIASWSSACANAASSVSGDAADPSVLIQAHIADADTLVVTLPDPINVRQMVETAHLEPGHRNPAAHP
jgi:CPA2 family monovalent cation:H+ antiporter-2